MDWIKVAIEVQEVVGRRSWRDQFDHVVTVLRRALDSDVSLLMLRLSTGRHEYVGEPGEKQIRLSSEIEKAVELTIQTLGPVREGGFLCIPITRDRVAIFIVIVSDPFHQLRIPDDTDALAVALRPLLASYLERRLSKLLTAVRKPLTYAAPQDVFLEELGDLLLSASGMGFCALRQLNEETGKLELVEAWGFGADLAKETLSWEVDKFPEFRKALDGLTVSVDDISNGHLREINSIAGLEGLRSFIVTPVTVGNEPYGTLSFATSVRYIYLEEEKSAIATLANIVGVALAHYENTTGKFSSLGQIAQRGIRDIALEIASSARHEAKDQIDWLIQETGRAKANRRLTDRYLEETGSTLLDLSSIIDKIRVASIPPKYEKRRVHLKDLWDDSIRQLSGRLKMLKVDHRYTGDNPQVDVYYDWVRLCTMHLILNSIDAFSGKGFGTRKPLESNRRITLSVDSVSDRDRAVKFKYSDNAVGINFDRLMSPEHIAHLPPEERLFCEGTSTKIDSDGNFQTTGHGLYLVRKALEENRGGIQLVDWRAGVTFEITLPLAKKSKGQDE